MNTTSDVMKYLEELGDKAYIKYEDLPISESRKIIHDSGFDFPEHPKMYQTIDSSFKIENYQLNYRINIPTHKHTNHLVVFLHGGGWVFGSVNSHDHFARSIAHFSNSVVLSIDYPLAPEYKYPTSLSILYSFCCALIGRNIELPFDYNKVFICGDSAGGNLASAICLKLADNKASNFNGQILIYPVTDKSMSTKSYSINKYAAFLTFDLMDWFWRHYNMENDTCVYADLLSHPLKERQPPSLIISAEFDPLCDDAKNFHKKLLSAGNETELIQYEGVFHGFVRQSHILNAGKQALLKISQFINKSK